MPKLGERGRGLLFALAGLALGLALWLSDPGEGSTHWLAVLLVPVLAFGGYQLAGLRANLEHSQALATEVQRLNEYNATTAAEVQRLNQFNTTLMDAMAEGLVMEDAAGRLEMVNPALLKLLDYTEAELQGAHWSVIFAPDSRPLAAEQAALRRGGVASSYEARLLAKDGFEIPMLISATPVRRDGEYAGALAVLVNISDRLRNEAALQRVNDYLSHSLAELQQRAQEIQLLNELSDMLQACLTTDEARAGAAQILPRLFPAAAGRLYLLTDHGQAALAAAWGGPAPAEVFAADECWALRRGRPYHSAAGRPEPLCRHVAPNAGRAVWCVPLAGPEAALGVLCLEQPVEAGDAAQRLAQTAAHSLALAFTSLQLRETLRQQSIRDVLTGLYNRRHMEEALERELRRADRRGYPVGVIMLDLDNFKHFNDTFGHAAGDRLLQTVGVFLGMHIRAGDVACRFGGEEFVLILPEASAEVTLLRAEHLREEIHQLNPEYGGQPLGPVTASVGVALYPNHGATPAQLLRAADVALYEAKRLGRDRTVVAAPPAVAA